VRDNQQLPTIAENVADVAGYVPVAATLIWQQIARPSVIAA
jgi:hypothetical protein